MKKSHRTSKRRNPKVQRVVRKKKKAHRQRMKKEAKKLRAMGVKPRNIKKRLTIPNLCPFKEDLLRKVIAQRERQKNEEEARRLSRKNAKETKRAEREALIERGISNTQSERKLGLEVPKSLLKTSWFGSQHRDMRLPRSAWESRRLYWKELNKVITESDVIVEVLDARDPNGCRSRALERKIIGQPSNLLGGSKKVVLLLNKIDLIPSDVLMTWMRILRREYPVIAFKSSTQSSKNKLRADVPLGKVAGRRVTPRCVGGDALMSLLKNYSRNHDIKTKIVVGFIGYPNTGKSSVINSMKRLPAVGVGAVPGFTKQLQQVRLDKDITLIDSPGVIMNDTNENYDGNESPMNETECRLVLRNALQFQDVDCVEAVKYIVGKCNLKKLKRIYNMTDAMFERGKMDESLSVGEAFLFAFANQNNMQKRGGVADLERAARKIIVDWNKGKIPFYVQPPRIQLEHDEKTAEVSFVNSFAPEFDVNGLLDNNARAAVNVMRPRDDRNAFVVLEDEGEVFRIHTDDVQGFVGDDNDDDEDVEMDDGDAVMEDYQVDPSAFNRHVEEDEDEDMFVHDDEL